MILRPVIVAAVLLCAAAPARAQTVFVTIQRPGVKNRFVQLDFKPAEKPVRLRGCQTSARAKRCTRKRSRVPLTPGQGKTLLALWRATIAPPACRTTTRSHAADGKIWVKRSQRSYSARIPRHMNRLLQDPCRARSKLGWWLLRRYDRKKELKNLVGGGIVPKLRPPKLPWSKSRACKRHSDCVFAYRPCAYRYAPCGDRWREVANRAADKRYRAGWAIKVPACRPPLCSRQQKPGRWLGTKALCIKKQCAAR